MAMQEYAPLDENGRLAEDAPFTYTLDDAVKLLRWLDGKLNAGRTLTKDCGDHRAIKRALQKHRLANLEPKP